MVATPRLEPRDSARHQRRDLAQQRASLSKRALETIAEARAEDQIWVSAFTAWEIGLLAAKGRLALPTSPEGWFAALLELPGIRLAAASPAVLIAASHLPGRPPNDPADRIIVATARAQGLRMVTRDSELLAYAEAGHLLAIAC